MLTNVVLSDTTQRWTRLSLLATTYKNFNFLFFFSVTDKNFKFEIGQADLKK